MPTLPLTQTDAPVGPDTARILASRVAAVFRNEGFRVQTDYLAGLAYRYVASPATRTLLPIYNFIDATLFGLAIMRPFRPFVLTSGEKLT
jgi:hypothetical protein